MFKKRVKRGAVRDDSLIEAEPDQTDDGAVAAPKRKLSQGRAGDLNATANPKFSLDREHHSTMMATTVLDSNVAVLTEAANSAAVTEAKEAKAGIYTGLKKEKNPFGPMKAPANIRVVTRVDYQPDICKDYKETGYCGYGDSCKFLHDRGDYKAGWQIDKEWEEEQRLKAKLGSVPEENYEINSDDEKFPFACHICRQDFVNPVVTRCQHYFCQACALKRHKKFPKCAVCGTQTQGIFNTASLLIRKLKERKERDVAAAPVADLSDDQ